MQTIPVHTASAQYTVHVGAGLLPQLGARVRELTLPAKGKPPRPFVLTSPPIWALWGEPFLSAFAPHEQPHVLLLPPGEDHKRLCEVERLLEELAEAGADRASLLIAFGGGIVGDLGGFVAASFMRGIPFVQVPTTLLAQVDSSVGGKVGVNLAAGKNLAGAFHHPLAVFADTDLLSTLPERELRAGLMESLKGGIIRDPELFALLEHADAASLGVASLEEIVARSVALKASVVGADERESGLRMILNLGHTVGHAIEAVTQYKALLHGEAIGWGMLAAFHIAEQRGTVTPEQAQRMRCAVETLSPLPPFQATPEALFTACAGDKKNTRGTRRFILPRGIGDAVVVEDLRDDELRSGIEAMLTRVATHA